MDRERYTDFDLLRALIIVSAFILHYDLKIGAGVLAAPSLFIQRYIFSVGGFFFFIAGYMAKKIYLPAFEKNSKRTSARIFFKGLKILIIYLSYVYLMRVCTSSIVPDTFMAFIYDHRFTMRILFTFSLLFMLTPVILYFASRLHKTLLAMLLGMLLFIIFYNKEWPISFEIKKIFIDRTLSMYPLIPALMVYAFGYMAGIVDKQLSKRISNRGCFIIGAGLICSLWYFGFITNWKTFTFVESITPYLSVLLVRELVSWTSVKKYLLHPGVVCVGINSLSFYVISNIFLGLLQLTHNSKCSLRLIAFITTGAIAYLFTYWHNNSSIYLKSLAKPSP